MANYITVCRCGKLIKISYNEGESIELTCDNCGTKIKLNSSIDGVTVHFIPAT